MTTSLHLHRIVLAMCTFGNKLAFKNSGMPSSFARSIIREARNETKIEIAQDSARARDGSV